ncbi:Predicted amino acid racemase [Colwellia chukchiensis]|uniref:Predicted amino acid racemase n=1 Tax=Colwellia chukchiensis TaxID=641665 RepID=A0A1H7GL74_9GAMM|nr:alanine/ornithine racemase family PLP-dependent enzyme [Colwellia chukchiensis]SEK38834.1 Predicted amino acid racemase [Colwellia chukchiensis]
MYPRVEINLEAIKHNLRLLTTRCRSAGIDVAAVVKLVCGDPVLLKTVVDAGIDVIADSRLENFQGLTGFSGKKLLLRLPMLSQVQQLVDTVDISLNSEIEIMRKIAATARQKGKTHDIILMLDLGDLREGIIDSDVLDGTIAELLTLEGINLLGLGSNLTCFGGVMPSTKALNKLITIKNQLETKFQLKLDVISGGNSGCLTLLDNGKLPVGVNQLRLGTSIFMGLGLNDQQIPGLQYDNFILVTEIIEIMDKPSVPMGEIGLDASGKVPSFEDLGIRKKALCAIGLQDINYAYISALDKAIKILGMSSDHLVLDISDSSQAYVVGDKLKFQLSYQGVLSAMNSSYIYKYYHDGAQPWQLLANIALPANGPSAKRQHTIAHN